MLERDAAKRAATYEEMQREHQQISPFVIFAQEIETPAERAERQGHDLGPELRRQQVLAGPQGVAASPGAPGSIRAHPPRHSMSFIPSWLASNPSRR